MSECKVSVVMTTYNGEKYLNEQLDTIREQTVQADEVLILDDGSKDATVQMVRDYISQYGLEGSWRLIINEKNLGYADNFHKGMMLAQGDYIFFSDQDDIWLKDKIENISKVLDEHPEIMTLASEYEAYYATEDAAHVSAKTMNSMTDDGTIEMLPLDYHNIFINSEGCTMCVRKALLERIEKYWYSKCPHDEYVWKMAAALDGLCMYHKTTLRRRFHSDNVSTKKMHSMDKRLFFLENLVASHKMLKAFAVDEKMSPEKMKVIDDNVKSAEMRVQMLKNKKLGNILPLAFRYRKCYHSRKAIPVEFLMAIRG